MIPTNLNTPSDATEEALYQEPDLTYRVVGGEKITGTVDELEAIKQAIAVMLSVERYEHLIYSWDFGVELQDLIGQDVAYVCPESARRIKECLLQDERILGVDGWSFTKSGSSINVAFTVHTIYGDINTNKEVTI